MKRLSAPDRADTRSALADWLELAAVLDPRRTATRASLLGVLDIPDDDERVSIDAETGEALDEGILEERRTAIADAAFEELQYRSLVLGDCYPFVLDDRGTVLKCLIEEPINHEGHLVYLFCLLATGIRDKRLRAAGSSAQRSARTREIADAFQVCACLAAGGYLSGSVASFGFPRASGDAFLPALRDVFRRFGSGSVITDVPAGFPGALKDGGVDVFAWRDHCDRMPGKLYLVGQCASGTNWEDKSVVSDMEGLRNWVLGHPRYCTPAMFIPFPLEHGLNDSNEAPFEDVIRQRCEYWEKIFGIIFDRLRISHYAMRALALTERQRQDIDGADRLAQLRRWIDATLGRAVAMGAVA